MIGITERGDAALNFEWTYWVSEGKPAILITKNPLSLAITLENTLHSNPNIIVHATITGLGPTFEPYVPDVDQSVSGVKILKEIIGAERIVIRIDPIIPTKTYIQCAQKVYDKTKNLGISRYRVSFIDMYQHVRNRFNDAGIIIPWADMHAPLKYRQTALAMLNIPNVEICGEPGMLCHGCISRTDLRIFGMDDTKVFIGNQRKECMCLTLKHELLNNKHPCTHGCLYCYWKD